MSYVQILTSLNKATCKHHTIRQTLAGLQCGHTMNFLIHRAPRLCTRAHRKLVHEERDQPKEEEAACRGCQARNLVRRWGKHQNALSKPLSASLNKTWLHSQ